MELQVEIAIVGGGIGGMALAGELAGKRSVALLEAEPQPGMHATGRSAAVYYECYGRPAVQALTRASRPLHVSPPEGFANGALATPLPIMMIASCSQQKAFEQQLADPGVATCVDELSKRDAKALVPALRNTAVERAFIAWNCFELDVHGLLQGYRRQARAGGTTFLLGQEVTAIDRRGSRWALHTCEGTIIADLLVNAAGAWAGTIGRLAGLNGPGLRPLRRSACTIDIEPSQTMGRWPMVVDIEERFYFKPDAGRLLLSGAEEIESEPCDAAPDEMDIAIAVDRLEQATALKVRRIIARWAGLRTFAADRLPLIGFDEHVPAFFWLAGQGGFGVQAAPAMAMLAADLILDRPLRPELDHHGVRAETFSPARFKGIASAAADGASAASCPSPV